MSIINFHSLYLGETFLVDSSITRKSSLPCQLQIEIWIACPICEFVLIKVRCHYFSQNLRNSSDSASHVQSKKFDPTGLLNIRTQKGLNVQTEAKKKLVARQKQIQHPMQLKRKNSTRFWKPACNNDKTVEDLIKCVYVISILVHVSYHIVFFFRIFQTALPKRVWVRISWNGVFSQRKTG